MKIVTICRIRGGIHLEVKNHKFVLASDLFNPIHIFHIFLAEVSSLC